MKTDDDGNQAQSDPGPTNHDSSSNADAMACYQEGLNALSQRDYELAITCLSKAIMLDQFFARAYYKRGIAFRSKGEYNNAVVDFDSAIHHNPENAPAYQFARCIAYHWSGDYDRAIADCNDLIGQVNEDNDLYGCYKIRGQVYVDRGSYDLGINDLSQAIRLKLKGDPYLYSSRGEAYWKKGDNENALADFSQAIQQDESVALFYRNRAKAYLSKESIEMAIGDLSLAIKLEPHDPFSYYYRGIAYFRRGHYVGALADFSAAIERKPEYPDVYRWRSETFRRLGKFTEAEADQNELTRLAST